MFSWPIFIEFNDDIQSLIKRNTILTKHASYVVKKCLNCLAFSNKIILYLGFSFLVIC